MIEQKDTVLIQNILNGSQIAEEILYKKYKKCVRDFLIKNYSNNLDLDDDVSEIMIKIFMNLSLFDSNKSKFKSWIFSIAKNYMIDKWRSNADTLIINLDTLSSTISVDNNSSISWENYNYDNSTTNLYSTNNIDFENCSSINYISSQISPQDYTLLDMKYVQGYDYCEIGNEFNLTSTTISNRVNYIKTKIKINNPELIY